MKNNRGVTLIVLIITIIVLIIIAGITISMTVNNGLVGKASNVVNALNQEVEDSATQLDNFYNSMVQRTTY